MLVYLGYVWPKASGVVVYWDYGDGDDCVWV